MKGWMFYVLTDRILGSLGTTNLGNDSSPTHILLFQILTENFSSHLRMYAPILNAYQKNHVFA